MGRGKNASGSEFVIAQGIDGFEVLEKTVF